MSEAKKRLELVRKHKMWYAGMVDDVIALLDETAATGDVEEAVEEDAQDLEKEAFSLEADAKYHDYPQDYRNKAGRLREYAREYAKNIRASIAALGSSRAKVKQHREVIARVREKAEALLEHTFLYAHPEVCKELLNILDVKILREET